MIRSSHIYWDGYEVSYSFDEGGITDFELYPKPSVDLSREQELEIIELIKEDIPFLEEDGG
jgi:hypothetical protein